MVALGSSACGGGVDGGERDAEPTTTSGPAVVLEVELYLPSLGSGARRFDLSCDPAGGTHPNAEAACAALEAHPEALEPVPKDVACTQEFGGPERAEVHGTVNGDEVVASFNRRNGCEIARWESLAPLFQVARRG